MERITSFEREQIASFKKQGLGVREIARRIGRDHSVVSRELRRNKGQLFPYEAEKAQYFAERRAKKTNVRKIVKHIDLKWYIRAGLIEGWSPEQIAGRLKTHQPLGARSPSICHEAIYQWIYTTSPLGEPWLYHALRRKHYTRRLKTSRKKRQQVQIKELVPIAERPELPGAGHFEVDSVVGKGHKSALSVHYERSTQYVRIHPLDSTKAEETKAALIATIEDLPPRFVKSLTFDRGSETALHYTLRSPYNLQTFHCDPYCPYQKGGVENINGLIRQYFPKGTDFRLISTNQVQAVEHRLNSRPRKQLDFKTPNEMLSGALNC
jgi:IS30 family transposase